MALKDQQQRDNVSQRGAEGRVGSLVEQGARWHEATLHGGVLLLYSVLAVLVLWPLPLAFTTGLIGADAGVDAFQCAWNIWWVAEALSQGQLPFFTWLLFFPEGVDLFWQTLQFSQGVVAAPVTRWLGPIAGVNLTVLSSFIFGGYVAFLFARHVTGSVLGALLAGMVFAFSPYHLQKVIDGGLEVAAIQWLPCYFFALYWLLERPHWTRSLLSGALLLWVSLGSWYYGLFCVMVTGLVALVWLVVPGPTTQGWGWPDQRAWRTAGWALTPVFWWGGVLLPQLLRLSEAPDALWDMRAMQAARSADLLDFLLPNPLHPLWGEAVSAMRAVHYPDAVIWNVALGWVGLGLGLIGMIRAWPHARRWAVLFALTLLLAMGPTLRVAGFETGFPLPFALIQDLPGIRSGQRPNHIVAVASLLLGILAAYGVGQITRGLDQGGRLFVTASLVALIMALDGYAGPMQIERRAIHPFYTSVDPAPFAADGRPQGALMPLPLYVNINRSENLTPQMVHRWPILGGYVARPPVYTFSRYAPGIRELEGYTAQPDDILSPAWPALGQHTLAAYGIRYVTLDLSSNKDDYFALVRETAARLELGPPIVADAQLEVYEVPQTWPVGPVGYLGPGWQDLEHAVPYRWRWMGQMAEIRLFNPLDHPTLTTLRMHAASYAEPRWLSFELGALPVGQVLVEPDVPLTHHLHFLVPPGAHTLTLHAPATPDPARRGEPISLRLFRLEVRFQTPSGAFQGNVDAP